ncbi:MAG: divergent polysaccharide deacetylase family protein [Treponema sp.]|nr:divergent polysaccharide deacetylase family protein [Treponema sp.]
MKNSEKKSSSVKRSLKNTGKKRKRKKKLVLKDGIRAALIAGIFICVSVVVAVSIIIAHSAAETVSEEHIVQELDGDAEPLPKAEIPAKENLPAVNPPQEKPSAVSPETKTIREDPAKIPEKNLIPELPVSKPVDEKPVQIVPPLKPPEPIPSHRGTVALVMDDAGNNLQELDAFLTFSGPMTIAVLPGLPYSAEAARRIRAAGKELILHQPMEAIGGQNPGPGAIYTNMSDAEIRAILKKNLAELGPVSGMNNHQGSKASMDERVMEIILSICHDEGIYFLDSRTTADTVAPLVAERRGTKIWERDVFLDNIQERAAMIRSFHEGLQKAEQKGGAIMIGHVWSSELAATLEELYPELIEQGFSLSTISKIMMGTIDNDGFWD